MALLGTLQLDLSAPTERLSSDLNRAQQIVDRQSQTMARSIGMLANPIITKVDDRALTALNAHLTLKEQHLDRVVGKFGSSKITPVVDDRQLTQLKELLDRVSGNRQIGLNLGSGEDLSNDIAKSIEKGFKSAKGNLATNVVSKAVDTATSPFRSIARGAMENFGRALTDPFSQGIAGALNDAISGTVGSQKLVGEKIGETIAAKLREKIGKSLGVEIKDLAEETLGRENIDREYGSSKSKSTQFKQNQTIKAADRLNADRQNLAKEYYQDLAQTEEIKSQQSRVVRVRNSAEQKLQAAQEATYNARVNGASPQRINRLERVELGRATQLSAVNEFAANLDLERTTIEARMQKNKSDRAKLTDRIDTLSPEQNRSYQQIAEQAAGRKLKPSELPTPIVADAALRKIGANASYSENANVIYVTSELDRQAKSNRLTGKNTETLFHENIHAVDQGFGSIEGIRAGKRGDVLTNRQFTPDEVAFAAPYVEQYPEKQRKGELNAYAMQYRNREAFNNQDRKLALEEFQRDDNYGSAGKRYKSFVSRSTESNKQDLSQLVGILPAQDVRDLIQIRQQLKAKSAKIVQDVNKSVGSGQLVDGLEDAILSNIKEFEQFSKILKLSQAKATKLQQPATEDPWSDAKDFARTQGTKAKQAAGSLAIFAAGKAGEGAGGLVRATGNGLDRVATGGINRVLARNIDPNVIDLNPRQISSVRDLTRSDLLQAARLGTHQIASAAAPMYGALQGVENAALTVLPFGKQIKSFTQKTVLPAAAFAAASNVPIIGPAVSSGLGHVIGGGLDLATGGAAGAIGSQFSSIPLIGGAIQSALSGTAHLGAELAAPIVTSILGGKSVLGAAQVGAKLILPQKVENKQPELEYLAQTVTQQKLEEGKARVSNLVGQFSFEPKPAKSLPASKDRAGEFKALPQSEKFEAVKLPEGQQTIPDLKWAKQVKENAKNAYKSLKEAIRDGNIEVAREIAKGFDSYGDEFISQVKGFKDATPVGKLRGEFNDVQTYLSRTRNLSREFLTKQEPDDDLDGLRRQISSPQSSIFSKLKQLFSKSITNTSSTPIGKPIAPPTWASPIPDPWEEESKTLGRPLPPPNRKLLGKPIAPPTTSARFDPQPDGILPIPGIGQRERELKNESLYRVSPAARRYDRAYNRINQNIDRQFTRSSEGIGEQIDRIGRGETPVNKVESAFSKLASTAKLGLLAFTGYNLAAMGVPAIISAGKAILDLTGNYEQLQIKLQASTGSLETGRQRFAAVRADAQKLGVSQIGALETASRISATTFGTELEGLPSNTFSSQITQIAQARGLSQQQQNSLSLAISQILGKPRVSAEELNQLVESGGMPDARTIGARALGMTSQQMSKALESGSGINSSKFIGAFLSQANADSQLVKDEALNTQQAKFGKLQSNTENLQLKIGEGINPAFKTGIDLLSSSIELLTLGIDKGSKVLIGFAAVSLVRSAAPLFAMAQGFIASGQAASFMGAGINTLTTLAPKLAALGLQMAAFFAIAEGLRTIGDDFSNTSQDMVDAANKLGIALDQLDGKKVNIDLPQKPEDVQGKDWTESTKLGVQRGFKSVVSKVSDTQNAIQDSDWAANLRRSLGIEVTQADRDRAKIAIPIDSKQKEQNDRDLGVQSISEKSQLATKRTLDAIGKTDKLKQIDLDLNRLGSERSGLFAGTSEPDAQQVADLNKRYREKYQERTKLTQGDDKNPGLAKDQAIAQQSINALKGAKDKLDADLAKGQIAQPKYQENLKVIERDLKAAEEAQRKLNEAIKSGLDDLTPWTRELAKIAAKFEDINTGATISADKFTVVKNNLETSGKITRGQAEFGAAKNKQDILAAKDKAIGATIKELEFTLNSKDPDAIKNVKKNYSVNDNTSSAQLKIVADAATSPQDKQVLTQLATIRDKRNEQINIAAQISDARAEVYRKIYDENQQAKLYYVSLAQQLDPKGAEFAQATSKVVNSKNTFLAKLNNFGTGLFDVYTTAYIALLDAGKDKLEAQAKAAQEKKAALDAYQNRSIAAIETDRNRFTPRDKMGDLPNGKPTDVETSTKSRLTPPTAKNNIVPIGRSGNTTPDSRPFTRDNIDPISKTSIRSTLGKDYKNYVDASDEASIRVYQQSVDNANRVAASSNGETELKKVIAIQALEEGRIKAAQTLASNERKRKLERLDPNDDISQEGKQRRERVTLDNQLADDKDVKVNDVRSLTNSLKNAKLLIAELKSKPTRTPEEQQILDATVRDLPANERGVKQAQADLANFDKLAASKKASLEQEQKYQREVTAENNALKEQQERVDKLKGSLQGLNQQLESQPFNMAGKASSRTQAVEVAKQEAEIALVRANRDIIERGRASDAYTPAMADRDRAIAKSIRDKAIKNATEKQSQDSLVDKNLYTAERRTQELGDKQLVVSGESIKVRGFQQSDKADAPFANTNTIDYEYAQKVAESKKLELEREKTIAELRIKYKGAVDPKTGRNELLDTAEAQNTEQKRQAEITAKLDRQNYEQQINTYQIGKRGYEFGQSIKYFDADTSQRTADRRSLELGGRDTRENDFDLAVRSKQKEVAVRLQDLRAQRDAITELSPAADKARADIDAMMEATKQLAVTDITNLSSQFDRFNQLIRKTQDTTQEVFTTWLQTGKFDWRKILTTGLDDALKQITAKLVPDLFSGLYRKPEKTANPDISAVALPNLDPTKNGGDKALGAVTGIFGRSDANIKTSATPGLLNPDGSTNEDVAAGLRGSNIAPITAPIDRPVVSPLIPPQLPQQTISLGQDEMVEVVFSTGSTEIMSRRDAMEIVARRPDTQVKPSAKPIEQIVAPPPAPINEFDGLGEPPQKYRSPRIRAPQLSESFNLIDDEGVLDFSDLDDEIDRRPPLGFGKSGNGFDIRRLPLPQLRTGNTTSDSLISMGLPLIGKLFGFADGGIVPQDPSFRSAREGDNPIAVALRKEGNNSIIAALTPGERILNLNETRIYQTMFPQGIANFNEGGVAGGIKPIALSLDPNKSKNGDTNVNFSIDNSGKAADGQLGTRQSIDALRSVVVQELLRQKRNGSGLVN